MVLMEMEEHKYRDIARQILNDYLQKKGLRKTPERIAILDEIYSRKEHFNVESLYEFLSKKKARVSKATIYNTLSLLLDCKIVIKHQFGKNTSIFESYYNAVKNDHLICTNCGKIIEFENSEIHKLSENIAEKLNFKADYHSLYIYGVCKECIEL